MLACKKWLNAVLFLILGLYPLLAHANLQVEHAHVRWQDANYVLDARINYTLSDITRKALHHGLSLIFVLNIKVERARWYLWDLPIYQHQYRYKLHYYALSDQYSLVLLPDEANTDSTTVNTEELPALFSSLDNALQQLGEVNAFPLLSETEVDKKATYWVYLQTYLDIEALPPPLRPVAYLSKEWRLSSEWYTCPLVPTS